MLAVVDERLGNQSLGEWNADLHKELAKIGSCRNKPRTYAFCAEMYLCKPLSYNVRKSLIL